MIKFKYCRADTDKTEDLIQTISQLSDICEKVYVVVPEQLSLQRELSLGSNFSDCLSVVGFNRLTNEIFRKFGGCATKTPDDVMIAATVYKAVSNKASELSYYKSVFQNSGFVSKLISAFSEFETNCISEKAIFSVPENEMSASTYSKYKDLMLIYNEYRRLWGEGYKCPGDDIVTAAEKIELCDFFGSSAVIFDGFYGFTPSQMILITQILLQCPNCVFYFTTDMQSEIFDCVDAEIDKIVRECKKNDLSFVYEQVKGKCRIESDVIKYIEKNALVTNTDDVLKPENTKNLTVYSGKNLSEELGFIACKIKNDVLSGKYRYRDIAIMVPGIDSIGAVANAVFEKHNVPVFIDNKKTLLSKPLMAFLLCGLETVTDGFEYETVFSFLKTGLTGIEFDDISLIENYARLWKIKSKGWSEKEWTQNPSGLSDEYTEKDIKTLEKINSIKNRIYYPLCDFANRIKKAKNCNEMLSAVYDLTEAFDVKQNLLKIADSFLLEGNLKLYDEYIRVYDLFIDMLDSIDKVIGSDKMSVYGFYDMMTVCAGQVILSHRPARVDEVVIAGIGLVREEDIKCVYIPRLNDGILPSPFTEGTIITESDKRLFAKYGINLSMDFIARSVREKFELYVALTSPSNELVLSMSAFEITGEMKQMSDYLKEIINLTGISPIEREDLPDDFFLVSVAAASELAGIKSNSTLSDVIFELTGITPIPEGKENETLTDEIVQSIYSRHLRLSFSSIEEYVSCPFKFYLHKGLRVNKTKPVEFNPANMGSFIHTGLERLLGGDYDVAVASEEDVRSFAKDISKDYYEKDLQDCKNRSSRFDYLFSRASYAFENAAVSVIKEIQNSDFVPYDFEIDISEYVKPITLDEQYSVSLTGSIDRVDIARGDNCRYAKIIDYKSGKQKFSLEKIYNGFSMQLPIYAGAVRAKHKDVKLAAMYYLKVGVPEIEIKDKNGTDDKTYASLVSDFYVRDGLFGTDDNMLERLDKTGEHFKKISDDRFVDETKMNALVDFTTEKIKDIGRNIVKGNIEISPVKSTDIKSCEYCEFKAICNIQKEDERTRKLNPMPKNFLEEEN